MYVCTYAYNLPIYYHARMHVCHEMVPRTNDWNCKHQFWHTDAHWQRSSAILIKLANVLDVHFQGQRFQSSIFESSCLIISQTLTDRANVDFAKKYEVADRFSIGTLNIRHWSILRVKVKVRHISTVNILKRWQIFQKLWLPANRKSHTALSLVYLHLTLVRSKGQNPHFNCRLSLKWWQMGPTLPLP